MPLRDPLAASTDRLPGLRAEVSIREPTPGGTSATSGPPELCPHPRNPSSRKRRHHLPTILRFFVLLWPLGAAAVSAQTVEEARQLFAEGRAAEAAEAFRGAAEAADDLATEAAARNNACVLFTDLGEPASALEDCERALVLRRQLDDDRGLARTLNNLARAQQNLGRFEAAEASYLEALEVNQKRGDVQSETLVRSNIGWLWTAAGRYAEATRQLAQALAIAQANDPEPWAARQEAVAKINYGVLLEKLGAYREALALYGELLDEATGLDRRQRATLALNRGVMFRNLGDPLEALEAFHAAAEELEALDDAAGLSNAWLNIGLAQHQNLGRLDDAERAYLRALEAARESGNIGEEIQDLVHLGRLHLDRGELEAARESFESSLALAEDSRSSEGRWAALEGRGRVFEASGRLDDALADFERAVEEIEEVREGLDRHAWRVGYFGDKRAVFAALVRVLARLSETAPEGDHARRAWEWVQRAKARELLDAVGAPAPDVTAEQLDELLEGGTLLELFLGEHHLYAWVGTSRGLRMVDLGPASPVIELARELGRALTIGAPELDELTAALSAALLATTDVLGSDPEHLYISADGPLRRIPFEVLDAGGEKLVERVTIRYLPNASSLAWIRRRNRERAAREVSLAALGNPSLELAPPPELTALETPGEILTQRFALAPLPEAEREIGAIAVALGTEASLRLGREATESAFRTLAETPGSVLHLATHTLLDDRPGGGAAIVLSPEPGGDGLLWASELQQVDVRRRLTVLSACRSAHDPSRGKDTLSSLSGALLAAGASAVVASLWDVDDASTAVFMEQLYFQLGQGLAPAVALRRTKQRLLEDPRWSRPEIWAAFVLVGDTGPVVPSKTPFWAWWLPGAGVGMLLAAGLLWRSRRSAGLGRPGK